MKGQLISTYEVTGGKIEVRTPYCDAVVAECRSWSGKWLGGAWILPASRLAAVQQRLGSKEGDLVEAEVGQDDWTGNQYLHVGWYVLAGRRGRDYGVDSHATLVSGSLPSRGGSVKNPRVDASSDARFRLWVPRDFAVQRNLQIVTDPGQPEDPEPELDLSRCTTDQLLSELTRRGVTLTTGEMRDE